MISGADSAVIGLVFVSPNLICIEIAKTAFCLAVLMYSMHPATPHRLPPLPSVEFTLGLRLLPDAHSGHPSLSQLACLS